MFLLRNHLEVVEDLSFLHGGREGGPLNRKPRRELIWSYGMPDTEGEWLPGRRGNDQGRVLGYHRRRDDDDFDHTRRNQGTRRHCSVSSWVRNPRCRGVVEDCVSSTRWRGGRSRVGHQVRTQVWKVKAVNEAKKKKKVSFTDPIATELKPPKRAQPDDSILLIKAGELGNEHTSSIIKDLTLMETAKIQRALSATLRLMERTLTATKEDLHFERPIELSKMQAIKTLIEQGNKRMQKSNIRGTMAAEVGLDA